MRVVRLAAIAWLLLLAPLELASTLSGWLARMPGPSAWSAVVLIALRLLVTAVGVTIGRGLLRHDVGDVRGWAVVWAAADLGTLAVVLASGALPSNLMPGDAPMVWLAYAVAALVVLVAAFRD